ncbi:NAD(P)-dependent alcohol dehydrogenase [Anoxynatronum buryatiense]|uniref:L-iditol 2-dehydrogenase n=1 Tax=Anoxynatronum buryatiense TaxID=489973 RepID=A0AA45WYP5_9CLOT|nr:NAD(P)-dependent alcohol dehydrogenase [Anoxynatronum buryatiense]SMP69224.1 L-iditol 2-dehydrogenase [Anoxynatronum buryatiense]
MSEKMKVAVMTALNELEMQERDVPTPQADEVLVKVDYVGICGSDLHYLEHGRIGNFIVEYPFVLGHEVGGTVVALGDEVKHLQVNDRVALEPQITCGECEFCKSGKYNLCSDVVFFATPPVDGVFQEYVAHKANLCFKLPENVSTMEGALMEPLSVGLHAVFQGGATIGQTAVVTGTGCIGLTSMLALKAMGVSTVIVVDLVDQRLEKAKELGADYTINGKNEDTVRRIFEITGGKGFDIGIETAGSEITTRQLIESAKKGANLVLVGYSPTGEETLPIGMALDKELTFKTVFRYRNSYPTAINAVSSGDINVKDIVTHTYDFEDIKTALSDAINKKDEVVKAVVRIGRE